MENMTKEEFEKLKNSAAEEIRELRERQTVSPPFPNFVKIPNRQERPTPPNKKQSDFIPPNERQEDFRFSEPTPTRQPPQKISPNRLGGFLKNINLTEMLKDKDSWLVLGLIFLLSNEEADESLILALAYILL